MKSYSRADMAVTATIFTLVGAIVGALGYRVYITNDIAMRETKAAEIVRNTNIAGVTINRVYDVDHDPSSFLSFQRCETSSGGWKVCGRFSSREEAEKQSLLIPIGSSGDSGMDPAEWAQAIIKSCGDKRIPPELKKDCYRHPTSQFVAPANPQEKAISLK